MTNLDNTFQRMSNLLGHSLQGSIPGVGWYLPPKPKRQEGRAKIPVSLIIIIIFIIIFPARNCMGSGSGVVPSVINLMSKCQSVTHTRAQMAG